jgi:parallel beta helix pectate lyase-like protein
MKRRLAVPFAIAAAMVALFLNLAPASAQSDRVWVSHTGDDANNCSESAPCKTFQVAYGKASIHGEVDCLDSGDFGDVVISKSITIDCHSFGGITNNALGGDQVGIAIEFDYFSDPQPDTLPQVVLRNLTISGVDNGGDGILIQGAGAGSTVNVENCVINGNYSSSGFRSGITDERSRGALIISNTTVHNNGAVGILIKSPNNGSRRAVIRNTVVTNSAVGISVGANSEVAIINSEMSDNATAGLVVSASTGSATVDSTTIAHNGFAFQNSGTVRLSNSNVMYNATGWTGVINTFTNNRFTNNGAVGPLVPIGSLSNPTGEQ